MLEYLLAVSLKGALVLTLAGALALALRRASSSARALVWALGIGGLLALPLLTAALPAWRVAGLRGTSVGAHAPAALGQAIVAVWLAGALLLLGRLAVAVVRAGALRRTASPVRDPAWLALRDEAARRLGLRRAVGLRRSLLARAPLTMGILRPLILLPAASDGWTDERRRAVLLHELAHVRRHDCLTQLLAQLACALHWPNPLVWLAATQQRGEREMAADDLVLAQGTRASDYAGHLLDLAAALCGRTRLGRRRTAIDGAGASIVGCSSLSARLATLLDAGRRRRPPGAGFVALATLAALGLLLPLASLTGRSAAGPSCASACPHACPREVHAGRPSVTLVQNEVSGVAPKVLR